MLAFVINIKKMIAKNTEKVVFSLMWGLFIKVYDQDLTVYFNIFGGFCSVLLPFMILQLLSNWASTVQMIFCYCL